MDKPQLQLEALKMVKEWGAWLAGIQTGICALLWSPLKDSLFDEKIRLPHPFSGPPVFLYLGWFAFLFSLLFTVWMLSQLPRLIEGITAESESVFEKYIILTVFRVKLKTTLIWIHSLFVLGAILIGVFIIWRAASGPSTM